MSIEAESLTDAEKIDWLWQQRDSDHQRIADLEISLGLALSTIDQRDAEIAAFRLNMKRAIEDVATMGRELNEARSAAANSVREYIANTTT